MNGKITELEVIFVVTRNKKNRKSAGFSLLEFLAVMVLVAVLALIAIPTYDSYIKKARYQGLIIAVDAMKLNVAACVQKLGITSGGITGVGPINCSEIPIGSSVSYTPANALQYTVAVGDDGKTVGVPIQNFKGISQADTYILTPTVSAGNVVTWTLDTANSGCIASNLCDNP